MVSVYGEVWFDVVFCDGFCEELCCEMLVFFRCEYLVYDVVTEEVDDDVCY